MDKKVSILGSTGSIGTQALDVVRKHSLSIYALAANRNVALLETQAREFHPSKVCVFDESYYLELKKIAWQMYRYKFSVAWTDFAKLQRIQRRIFS